MSGQDCGLAAAENQGDRRLGRGQIRAAVRHHQSPAPFHPGQVPVPACWPWVSRQARARACAAAARALAWSKKWPARGSLFANGVKIRSWVTIIQRLGCPASQPFRRDSRVLARQPVRSSFLFRLADIFISARRLGGCPGPEVPDARAEGRLSPTAVRHISAPRPRRAVPPGSSRGGHGDGRKAGRRDQALGGLGSPVAWSTWP